METMLIEGLLNNFFNNFLTLGYVRVHVKRGIALCDTLVRNYTMVSKIVLLTFIENSFHFLSVLNILINIDT